MENTCDYLPYNTNEDFDLKESAKYDHFEFQPLNCFINIEPQDDFSEGEVRDIIIGIEPQDNNVESKLNDFIVEYKSKYIESVVEFEAEETIVDSEPQFSILERLPHEIRQMVFVHCGRSAFCSAGQGSGLLQALRGQPLAYRHALSIFERLNSYELEARLKNDALGEDHLVDEMTRLMTVNQKELSPFSHLDLELTFYGHLVENQKHYGDFWASTPETVIFPLPNPENHLGSSTATEYLYHRENTYLNHRAKQDSLALAIIENIDKKLGVQGVILGRSKDTLSGFCMWEAPKGQFMDWSQEMIEPWALRGGFGKTFLDHENNYFELKECKRNGMFSMSNRYETKSMKCSSYMRKGIGCCVGWTGMLPSM
ncbi:hypothetical protein OCU04_005006 [Sclerotinia nivalis]|uniref:Uncharacterized protein n=1 Tax=Sclerotinia nivalis TaxID=352851 RepID=A0A9X0ANH8_9HELO|nr:hypothetical protein OCU04_005006 [Sclerotinia nivalis]